MSEHNFTISGAKFDVYFLNNDLDANQEKYGLQKIQNGLMNLPNHRIQALGTMGTTTFQVKYLPHCGELMVFFGCINLDADLFIRDQDSLYYSGRNPDTCINHAINEEVIHKIDLSMGFSLRGQWREAVYKECYDQRSKAGKLRRKLEEEFSEASKRGIIEKPLFKIPFPYPTEYLVTVISQIEYYSTNHSINQINTLFNEAYPYTLPLVIEFEDKVRNMAKGRKNTNNLRSETTINSSLLQPNQVQKKSSDSREQPIPEQPQQAQQKSVLQALGELIGISIEIK